MDAYATHLEALVTTALRTSGPMLELGCGDYSTPVLAAFARTLGRELLVQASDDDWASRFTHLVSHNVRIELVNWRHWTPPVGKMPGWGFVLLDSEESTADRIRRLPALATVASVVVMHDADKAMARAHWSEVSADWHVHQLYSTYMPHTVVLEKR